MTIIANDYICEYVEEALTKPKYELEITLDEAFDLGLDEYDIKHIRDGLYRFQTPWNDDFITYYIIYNQNGKILFKLFSY